MAERIEEKYLISFTQYSIIANRIRHTMLPDENGTNGRYSICSLYFDDHFDSALAEKENGDAVHEKFRIRTYDGQKKFIKLERKTKRGVITEKHSATLTEAQLDSILKGENIDENAECFGLVSEMRSKGFFPKISVRYDREAYVMPTLGIRVTFDINVDALPPTKDALFGNTNSCIPAIHRGDVIMEIKYSNRCPNFIRKCCANTGLQMSVSKYALCRLAPQTNF